MAPSESVAMPTVTVRDMCDPVLIATLTYSFARITAALRMRINDLWPRGAGRELRLWGAANPRDH
jgi:hypothetical protein